jgi:hypothetical protein
MHTRSIRIVGCTLLLAIAGSRAAIGELPPGAYKRMQDKAPEHLQIRILSVKTQDKKNGIQVLAEARVTAVSRSACHLKVGDVIRINYFSSTRHVPGPSPVPLLVQDRSYLAFLERDSVRDKSYSPAAGGRSFLVVE